MLNALSGSSSICCDVLRMHLSDLPEMAMPVTLLLSVDEWADVERTNWRTCFCCAVKKAPPGADVSGCCKKLVNLLFVPVTAAVAELLLLLLIVVWVLENFCTCFSATILTVDCALSCCINDAVSVLLWSPTTLTAVDDDCKLWLRVLCALVVLTLMAVPVDWAVAVDVVVVMDDRSSSSSFLSSPGAVTMYCGGSDSSTDIFVTLASCSFCVFLSFYLNYWCLCCCCRRCCQWWWCCCCYFCLLLLNELLQNHVLGVRSNEFQFSFSLYSKTSGTFRNHLKCSTACFQWIMCVNAFALVSILCVLLLLADFFLFTLGFFSCFRWMCWFTASCWIFVGFGFCISFVRLFRSVWF